MRITDIFFAFPSLILAMAIAGALGPSLRNALIAVAVESADAESSPVQCPATSHSECNIARAICQASSSEASQVLS